MSSTEMSPVVPPARSNPFFERIIAPLGLFFDPKDQFRRRILGEMGRFRPKIILGLESTRYRLRTAESRPDLEAAFRLRHEVFYEEMIGENHWLGWDVDGFDFLADHLLVIEKETDRVVGTYRVLSSLVARQFYSETEFVLDDIKSRPGIKIELGRACINKEHRNGVVLALLWKGVMQYAQAMSANLIFGCSSLPITHPFTVASVARYFREGQVADEKLGVRPRADHRIPGYDAIFLEVEKISGLSLLGIRNLVPPLLLGYFKAGAKVAPEPAFDPAFKCVDFFTVLETSRLSQSYDKRLART